MQGIPKVGSSKVKIVSTRMDADFSRDKDRVAAVVARCSEPFLFVAAPAATLRPSAERNSGAAHRHEKLVVDV